MITNTIKLLSSHNPIWHIKSKCEPTQESVFFWWIIWIRTLLETESKLIIVSNEPLLFDTMWLLWRLQTFVEIQDEKGNVRIMLKLNSINIIETISLLVYIVFHTKYRIMFSKPLNFELSRPVSFCIHTSITKICLTIRHLQLQSHISPNEFWSTAVW